MVVWLARDAYLYLAQRSPPLLIGLSHRRQSCPSFRSRQLPGEQVPDHGSAGADRGSNAVGGLDAASANWTIGSKKDGYMRHQSAV